MHPVSEKSALITLFKKCFANAWCCAAYLRSLWGLLSFITPPPSPVGCEHLPAVSSLVPLSRGAIIVSLQPVLLFAVRSSVEEELVTFALYNFLSSCMNEHDLSCLLLYY